MTGLLLILLSWLVGISPQTALAQAQAREADKEKIFQQLTLEKTLELQEHILEPALNILKIYAHDRPALQPFLDRIRLTASPEFTRAPEVKAYQLEQSDMVSMDLDYLLEVTSWADLIAVFATEHPEHNSIMKKALDNYQGLLWMTAQAKRSYPPPFLVQATDYLKDSTQVQSIKQVGAVIRLDIAIWAIVHEISHHILGHTKKGNEVPLSQRRLAELDADLYSFGIMKELGFSLKNIHSYFHFREMMKPLLIPYGFEVVEEERNTHPSWRTRSDALDNYMKQILPLKAQWISFRTDKFTSSLEGGEYALTSFHLLFPGEPEGWLNHGLLTTNDKTFQVGVEFEKGQAHLYSRIIDSGDVMHIIVEDPYNFASRVHITKKGRPKRSNSFIFERDSLFTWHGLTTDFKGTKISEIFAIPQKDLMLSLAKKMAPENSVFPALESIISDAVNKEGEVFLNYMKGEISHDKYFETLHALSDKFANDMKRQIGSEEFSKFLSVYLESPLSKLVPSELISLP